MNYQPELPWEQKDLPRGFAYFPEILSKKEEAGLLLEIRNLKWEEIHMHGVVALRKVVHFGHGYEYNSRALSHAAPVPPFLVPLQKKAAKFLEVKSSEVAEILITHYPVGAPIGWHRDAPAFESLFGVSLLGSCYMKLRPLKNHQEVTKVLLEPRSGYLIRGEARWNWQHHIPPQQEERYSITFRTLKS